MKIAALLALTLITTSALAQTDLNVDGNIQLNRLRSTIFFQGDNITGHRGGIQFLTFDNGTNFSFIPTNASGTAVNSTLRLGGFGAFSSNTVHLGVTGNIGVGTWSPIAPIEVSKNLDVTSGPGKLGIIFGRLQEGSAYGDGTFLGVRVYESQISGYGGKSFAIELSFYGNVNSSIGFYRGAGVNGGYLTFHTDANTEQMRILGNGNVAIGTQDPKGYKLAVAGKIVSEEVVVKLKANWPDFVFDDTFTLTPLSALETFIKAEKHLPEVPTAEQIKENGVEIGEMNRVLLKKIEELTLYLIEQDKRLMELEQVIKSQSARLSALETKHYAVNSKFLAPISMCGVGRSSGKNICRKVCC